MKTEKRILGFSGRILSGKGVLSNAICERYNGTIVTVASALKSLICGMMPQTIPSIRDLNTMKREGIVLDKTITQEDIEYISNETNVPANFVEEALNGKTTWHNVRDLLQFIGTDIIRAHNPNWHVEKLKENIIKASSDVVCVDDIRFPNERKAVEELGGESFFIIRPQSEIISNHASETSIRWQDFDRKHIILNEHTEDFLVNNFAYVFENGVDAEYDNPILLSGNEQYLDMNAAFGVPGTPKFDTEMDGLYEKLLNENMHLDSFRKNGIIIFHPENTHERAKFLHAIYLKRAWDERCKWKFVYYNPLIYENLKFRLPC